MLTENELWLLSFYRSSEIGGALFFGRLAKTIRDPLVQVDMTKHFADESQHAWYWTDCINRLGAKPVTLSETYQDQYSSAIGIPANLMEVLAITYIFEKRVVNQYAKHSNIHGLPPLIGQTLSKIMGDEKWHLEWVRNALTKMESDYGKETIEDSLERFSRADEEIYKGILTEHSERLDEIMKSRS